MTRAAPDLSLVIATYDRPVMLADTLASCLAQTNSLGLAIEILVMDNHPSRNGAPVAARLAEGAPFPVRYLVEPTRNMSVLRNRGFQEAKGRYLAFIDDDEQADPDWTDALVGALRATDAAIAVGPRFAQFAAGSPPPYDPRGDQFRRDLGLPDLAEIQLTRPDGKPRYGLGTGNSLFDLERCFGDDRSPMRPAFGDAGGEDAELFVRLHRAGRRIVWAAKAKVTETVLPHRTEVGYRLIRTRRETQHYVAIYLDGARHPRLARATLWAKGLAQLAAGGLLAALTGEFGSNTRLKGRLLMEHGRGKLRRDNPVGFIAEPVQTGPPQ
jgi:glycosyltransferase involved in cell wall biosynthesis